MNRLLSLLMLICLATPALAAPQMTVTGVDTGFPASAANPFPVSIAGSSSSANVNIQQGGSNLSATNPIFTTTGGVATASITNATTNVANSSTAIALAAASRHIIIKTDPTSAVVYIDLAGGTATSADFRVEPGGALSVDLGTAISTFNYIGASATGTISVCAY